MVAQAQNAMCSSGPRPAAPCKFAVNHDCGYAADAVLLCFGRYFSLVHVVDDSWEEPANLLTTSIPSLHVEQPALKTLILFLVTMIFS